MMKRHVTRIRLRLVSLKLISPPLLRPRELLAFCSKDGAKLETFHFGTD
jgi:hypothetical protein